MPVFLITCFSICPIYNGQMLRDQKDIQENLKDANAGLDITIKDTHFSISYTKTNKLITALYMVTDIVDKEEPLRSKLRTLGADIISDMHSHFTTTRLNLVVKIQEVLSFLDIASAINMISEMNCSILKKEFLELKQSIEESMQVSQGFSGQANLLEFFKDENLVVELPSGSSTTKLNSKGQSIGHKGHKGHHTRLGVQKGSTLMKALSGVGMSNMNNFDTLKQERRSEIMEIIKANGGNATITDIKIKVQSLPADRQGALISCSEKTIQRELISMVKDNVLQKTGDKRWSRYSLPFS